MTEAQADLILETRQLLAENQRLQALLDAPYSIDADPKGVRANAADAIRGALALGAQGSSPPPDGHWLAEFWNMASEERRRPPEKDAEQIALGYDAAKWREWCAAQELIEKQMPEGYTITMGMSPGDWSLSLTDPEGEALRIDDYSSTASFVRLAVELAREHLAKQVTG